MDFVPWLRGAVLAAALVALPVQAETFRPGTLPWSAAVWTSGQLAGSDIVHVQQSRIDAAGTSGSGVGVGAQIRWRMLVVGALQDWNIYSFGYHETWLAATCGASLDLAPEVRLELIGLAGRHHVTQLGEEPWRTARTANDADLPFLGVRPTIWLRLPAQVRATAGVWLDLRHDLSHRIVTVQFQDDDLPTPTHDTYRVGGNQTAVGVQIALEWEWTFSR